ncbi:hypothetical protein PUN28_002389 [Cardiocondyla obscurior]|uniref:Uncharacterized protein n=1 Tax=Cardiocondyla obscurior TaxID=286306 RepID=A0AAW2GTV0_9HYME
MTIFACISARSFIDAFGLLIARAYKYKIQSGAVNTRPPNSYFRPPDYFANRIPLNMKASFATSFSTGHVVGTMDYFSGEAHGEGVEGGTSGLVGIRGFERGFRGSSAPAVRDAKGERDRFGTFYAAVFSRFRSPSSKTIGGRVPRIKQAALPRGDTRETDVRKGTRDE